MNYSVAVLSRFFACIADANDGDCLIFGHSLVTRLIEVDLLVQILIDAATFLCHSHDGLHFGPVSAVHVDRLNLGACYQGGRLGWLLVGRLVRIWLLLDREQSRLGGIGRAALDVKLEIDELGTWSTCRVLPVGLYSAQTEQLGFIQAAGRWLHLGELVILLGLRLMTKPAV